MACRYNEYAYGLQPLFVAYWANDNATPLDVPELPAIIAHDIAAPGKMMAAAV